MAGRPPLRIGQHVKITRKYLGGGVWFARARFRDADGVTRIVQRRVRRMSTISTASWPRMHSSMH